MLDMRFFFLPLSPTKLSSLSSSSRSYSATQASQLGISVFALGASQIHWSSALSLSGKEIVSLISSLLKYDAHTSRIVAASGRQDNISTDCGALLRDIILRDILASDECCKSRDDNELLKKHVCWLTNVVITINRILSSC